MSGPAGNVSTAKINGRYLRAFFCGAFAWACWLGFEAGSVLLGCFAAIFACGAIWHGVIALFQTLKAIVGSLKWTGFQRGRAAPKADPMVRDADLRAKGLLK